MLQPSALRLLVLVVATALGVAGGASAQPVVQASAASPGPSLEAAQALPPGYAYPAGDTVRVVTYNIEHFVDGHDNPYVRSSREDAPDAASVAEKARLFARALRALRADVVVLQEVESEAYVRVLADSLLPDLGYRFFASTPSADWYQNVVVMSRLPLGLLTGFGAAVTPVEGVLSETGEAEATSLVNHRLFTVEVRARPGYAFTLVAAHLKAGADDRNDAWRRGQVGLLHAHLARLHRLDPAVRVLVAGDLNAVPGSPAFERLRNADGQSGPVAFVDPLAALGEAALTHPSTTPRRRLDHLLVSETMAANVVTGSARVARPLGPDELVRLSDHLPVVVEVLARP